MRKVLFACLLAVAATSCGSISRIAPESYAKKLTVEATQCVEGTVMLTGKQKTTAYTDYYLTTCKGPVTVRHSGDDYTVIR